MANYSIGGQSVCVLDMSSEYDAPSRQSNWKPFAERAAYLAKETEYQGQFLVVYTYCGELCTTSDPKLISRLSLSGQSSVYPSHKKHLVPCDALAVFCYNGVKYKLLYELKHYKSGLCPIYLCKEKIEVMLRKFFKVIDVKLGVLSENEINSIAWQIQTEEGTFFIRWHNGCLSSATGTSAFEEKTFAEIKKEKIYSLLRFESLILSRNCYRIVCC